METNLLSQRAVRAKAFKPMNGMLMRSPVVASRTWRMDQGDHGDTWDEHDAENWYLDLNDAASRGCLLEVIREAYGMFTICVKHELGGWYCAPTIGGVCAIGDTEAEALVKALEAAP